MSGAYRQLLNATIAYVEGLKADGSEFVQMSSRLLEEIAAPVGPPAKLLVGPSAGSPEKSSSRSKEPQASQTSIVSGGEEILKFSRSTPLTGEAKTMAMAELRTRALICRKCPHLASTRKNVVFGVGDINSPLMFVGEAPGADEDEAGEPFVGKAGLLLTRMIQTMGLTRENVYIANILKCRPDTPGQSFGNRKPEPHEMKTCLPYLLEQIDLIRPKVMVALGGVALEGLFGKTSGITKARGQFQLFQNIPVMPTYHPAYLLRNPSIVEKRKVWEDLLQVLTMLEMPITEKQRNYFLS